MNELPQIPGYQIIKKLGQGGMADVYLGVQENLARKVAIKVLIPSLFRDKQFSTRFVKEAQTAAHLAHPNIITIHDIGRAGDSYYIVMEYLEESLSNRMKQGGPLPPREALEIVKMIAGALDYAHKKGFIHRDIKPDNIMFRTDGTVVLVDFGIARAMDSGTHLTRTGMSIGTPHYMSPEQCKGEKIDGRSDIYSLGVELYEILTGDVPYKAENTAGIIIKHIQDPVPRLPKKLSSYQPLIDKMMAKDRNARTQTGEELINFIDGLITAHKFVSPTVTRLEPLTEPEIAAVDEQTVLTSYPTADVSPPKRKERKKWLLPALLAFAFVTLAGVSAYFITQNPPERKVEEKTETKTKTSTPVQIKKEKEAEVEKKAIDTPKKDTAPVVKRKQTIRQPQEEKKPKKSEQKPVKPTTLLGVTLDLRKAYNTRMQRLQINVGRTRFQAKGQVVLNLSIDEKGRVTIRAFRDILTVIPPRRKKVVLAVIRRQINGIFLAPPKDKNGQPVRVVNWRLTYKVGRLGNKIFLTKQ